MQYRCIACDKNFMFDDNIAFCPYCGNKLGEIGSRLDLAQTLDSIWGDQAKRKSEIQSLTEQCIVLANTYIDRSIERMLSERDLSKYGQHYAAIRQSNNRKTLLIRIERFLDSLGKMIDELDGAITARISDCVKNAAKDAENIIGKLYDFLEIPYAAEADDSVTMRYPAEQLRDLYQLVLQAYVKYKKCVEDNNMFAAFASTSDYGTMAEEWRELRYWLFQGNNGYGEREQHEALQIEQVIDSMKAHNNMKYAGLLDEDFVPHVDAFWDGLESLCCFIDQCINIPQAIQRFRFTDEDRTKILRKVQSVDFEITEEKLDQLAALKKRLEESIQAFDDAKASNEGDY